MKVRFSSHFFRASILFFFLFPYIALLKFFNFDVQLNFSEVWWALKNSLLQSSVAALICIILGYCMALGLFNFSTAQRFVVSKLVLLPQVLPSLFSIMIAFSLVKPFPMGHGGVVIIFILINLGFAAFQIHHAITTRLGNLALVADVFGISSRQFKRKVLLRAIWPDLFLTFILIFLFCFSSLSVPLVAGGGKGTNLEVLIFEKIFIEQSWDSAWVLMVFQTTFIFTVSYFLLKPQAVLAADFQPHRFYKSRIGFAGIIIYLLSYLGSYLFSLAEALLNYEGLGYMPEIAEAALNSILFLLAVGAVCFGLFIFWLFDFVENLQHSPAIHLISVSTVLVGFSLYIFLPQGSFSDLFKIPVAFAILFFPALFKMFLQRNLEQLKSQIIAAKVFGISRRNIVQNIVLSQFRNPLFYGWVVLSIWCLSDFAISRALGTQSKTLGLMAETFLTSYRLEDAYIMSAVIMSVWLISTFVLQIIFKGIYGNNKKH